MDSKRIEELLERYWAAETTLEEEQQLHQYFKHGNVPESLRDTATMFRYFEEQKKKSINDDGLSIHQITGGHKHGRVRRLVYNSMRIAAGVAVVIASVWFVRRQIHSDDPVATVDTYEDPKVAFEETKKALLMISRSFGKAEEETRKINLFNKAQEEVKKKQESQM